MDSNRNKSKSGKGRGSFLLEMMKQRVQMERSRAEELAHSIGTPSVSSAGQTSASFEGYSLSQSSSSSGGRGRAQLALLKSMSESSSSSGIGHGRGSLLGLAKRIG